MDIVQIIGCLVPVMGAGFAAFAMRRELKRAEQDAKRFELIAQTRLKEQQLIAELDRFCDWTEKIAKQKEEENAKADEAMRKLFTPPNVIDATPKVETWSRPPWEDEHTEKVFVYGAPEPVKIIPLEPIPLHLQRKRTHITSIWGK